jgi:hypothetical protein
MAEWNSLPKLSEPQGWRTADGRWACSGCGRKVSVAAGTIFDRVRIPLSVWFAAAWYITRTNHGVSARQLQRRVGVKCFQTARTMLAKLRAALKPPIRLWAILGPLPMKVSVKPTYRLRPRKGNANSVAAAEYAEKEWP